jgi:hypothetical protein
MKKHCAKIFAGREHRCAPPLIAPEKFTLPQALGINADENQEGRKRVRPG